VKTHIEAETIQHDVAAALATFHHPRYEAPWRMAGTRCVAR
jgi:hypothetical protein